MNKAAKVTLKIVAGFFLVVLLLLFSVPLLFKGTIREKVETVINNSVNARVEFGGYKLGFFRHFPNLTFSVYDFSITGTGSFENEPLATIGTFDLVFNLKSLFGNEGYEIRSIMIDNAIVRTLVLDNGDANWDIMKESDEDEDTGEAGDMKILLRKVALTNSSVSYMDAGANISAFLKDLSGDMTGDMTLDETNLDIALRAGEMTFIMDGIRYLDRALAVADVDLMANLDSMKFTFGDNFLSVNDMKVNFAGWVSMPGDDIATDLTFNTGQTSFKTLLSLIPAFYMSGFEDLNASGEFSLDGSAKGIYSDADSTLPDVALAIEVSDGLISYPALPEKITDINLSSSLFVDGRNFDGTTVDVKKFHMELAGNPFDMSFSLKTPETDPDFNASLQGRIDLEALENAMPSDSISMAGLLDMAVVMAGKLSMLDNKQYDRFSASGKLGAERVKVEMTGYPAINIDRALLNISPAFAELTGADLRIAGSSDISLSGRIENYIQYLFRDETLRGNLSARSEMINISEILSQMSSEESADDTSSLELIRIPGNIDLDLAAAAGQFIYGDIKVNNVKGHITLRDGVMSLKETGMDLFGGTIRLDADYDTRDTLKPIVSAALSMYNVAVREAFNTFNIVRQFLPAAKGIDGRFGMNLNYSSLLGNNMMPVPATITGGGKVTSDEVTLLESGTYNALKQVLKLNEKFSNTFRDLNISFKVGNGRLYVSPFDVKVGNIKMNVGGDQGLDQTLNYIIKTEIPRTELGSSANSLIESLSSQASAFGLAFRPSEVLKVNLRVAGTFGKPSVTPFFGDSQGSAASNIVQGVAESAREAVSGGIEDAREKASQEASAQAERLIREAEEKGALLKEEAAKAADRIRQEADQQAGKIIKEAESRGTIAQLAARKSADALRKEAGRRAEQLIREADEKAALLIEEARLKSGEVTDKI